MRDTRRKLGTPIELFRLLCRASKRGLRDDEAERALGRILKAAALDRWHDIVSGRAAILESDGRAELTPARPIRRPSKST